MPSEALIDPAAVDLSNVVLDREAIQRDCRQRGRMSMLDAVVLMPPDRPLVVGYKDIRSDDWWAADHIPGRPLFPGALMVEAAAQLSTVNYMRRYSDDPDAFVGFRGIEKTRFRDPVAPDCRLVIAALATRIRSRIFVHETQGFVDGAIVFEATVLGTVV